MKKTLLAIAAVLATLTATAQEIKKASPAAEDLAEMLRANGLAIDRFDISALNAEEVAFEIFFDEYVDGKKVEKESFFNIAFFHNFGKQASDVLTSIDTSRSDSIAHANVTIKDAGSMARKLPLRKINDIYGYCYRDFPFKLPKIDRLPAVVPLKLLASYYFDEEGTLRCCDSLELEPDFSNDVFKNSPHYYVIGLTISPR